MKRSTEIKREFYENDMLLNQTRNKIQIVKNELIPYYGGDMTLQTLLDCLEQQEMKFIKNIENIFEQFDRSATYE